MEQKFFRLCCMSGVRLTACAVSRRLPELAEPENYAIEPNQEWRKNTRSERAWVKIYCNFPALFSTDKIQVLIVPMPFLGKDYNDYWGEIQIRLKNSPEGRKIKLGRNQSFDTRVSAWVKETAPINPKRDLISHAYIPLRLYHQDHLPPVPQDWRFEPLYVAVADESFYRIDAKWEKDEITVTSMLIDKNLAEIPEFLGNEND